MGPINTLTVEDVKALRVQADALIQEIENALTNKNTPEASTDFNYYLYSMASYQAQRAAMEAKMWLGKMLEGLGNPFPAELADKAVTSLPTSPNA